MICWADDEHKLRDFLRRAREPEFIVGSKVVQNRVLLIVAEHDLAIPVRLCVHVPEDRIYAIDFAAWKIRFEELFP